METRFPTGLPITNDEPIEEKNGIRYYVDENGLRVPFGYYWNPRTQDYWREPIEESDGIEDDPYDLIGDEEQYIPPEKKFYDKSGYQHIPFSYINDNWAFDKDMIK